MTPKTVVRSFLHLYAVVWSCVITTPVDGLHYPLPLPSLHHHHHHHHHHRHRLQIHPLPNVVTRGNNGIKGDHRMVSNYRLCSFLPRRYGNGRLYGSNTNTGDGPEEDSENDNDNKEEDGITNNGTERLKPNFERLFQGVPSLNDILRDPSPSSSPPLPSSTSTYTQPELLAALSTDSTTDDSDTSASTAASSSTSPTTTTTATGTPLTPEQLEQLQHDIERLSNTRSDITQRISPNPTNDDATPNDTNTDMDTDQNSEAVLNQIIDEQTQLEQQQQQQREEFELFLKYQTNRLSETTESQTAFKANDAKTKTETDATTTPQPQDTDGVDDTNDTVVNEIIQKAAQDNERQQSVQNEVEQFRLYEQSVVDQYQQKVDGTMRTVGGGIGGTTGEGGEKDTGENGENSNVPSGDFEEVQLELMRNLLETTRSSSSSSTTPDDNENDENDEEDLDYDLITNLERTIEQLQARIAARNSNTSATAISPPKPLSDIDPKEWQMYRAIATRRAQQRADAQPPPPPTTTTDSNPKTNPDPSDWFDTSTTGDTIDELWGGGQRSSNAAEEEDSIEIQKQVTAWKEFQKREEEMRKATGLSIGTRMPFVWDEKDDDGGYDRDRRGGGGGGGTMGKPSPSRKLSKKARYELDQLAVGVLQDLMKNTADLDRRQSLKDDIDAMKLDLEARLLAGLDEDEDDGDGGAPSKPMDLPTMDSILGSGRTDRERSMGDGKTAPSLGLPQENVDQPSTGSIGAQDSSISDGGSMNDGNDGRFNSSALYLGNLDQSDETVDKDENTEPSSPLPPPTGITSETPNLGSYEQQKLRSVVAGSGVRTVAEEEKLRREWEEFQKAEQQMRDKIGLSSSSDQTDDVGKPPPSRPSPVGDQDVFTEFQKYEEETKEAMLKKMQKDGADDAVGSPPTVPENDDPTKKTEDDIIVSHKQATQWGRSSYSDQMYRSLSASVDNEVSDIAREKNKAEFQELMRKQDENRRALQDMPNATDAMDSEKWEIDDINSYAEKVLASLSARPKLKEKEEDKTKRASLSARPEVKEKEEDKTKRPSSSRTAERKSAPSSNSASFTKSTGLKTVSEEQMPDWLREELNTGRKEENQVTDDYIGVDDYMGVDDDMLDDDTESEEEEYLENERQAEEFGFRVLGATRAVDIGSVLGRDVYGTDGLEEYDSVEEERSSTFSSFQARKANLLGYTVLSVPELNALMEHKRVVTVKDVSPYASKMNRPFSEFAAIFRLEGVLVDTTGIQFEAWKRTAMKYNLKEPSLDDVRYASVHPEEFAIRRIFYWADDIITCGKIALTYREMIDDEIKNWKEKNQTVDTSNNDLTKSIEKDNGRKPNFLGQIETATLESDLIRMQTESWKFVANEYGFECPSAAMIEIAGGLKPDESIRGVFEWTDDVSRSKEIAELYRRNLRALTTTLTYNKDVEIPTPSSAKPETDPATTSSTKKTSAPTMDEIMELQYKAWIQTAQELNYPPPSNEEVYTTSFIDIEKAITSVFNWSLPPEEIGSVVGTFRKNLKELSQPLVKEMQVQGNQLQSNSPPKNDEQLPFFKRREGVRKWLRVLQDSYMPCVVLSYTNSEILDLILEETGLSEFFPEDKRVSSSCGYEPDMQQMLGGALRAERRPDECVCFSSTPQSAVSAHDVEMKNIALVSPYPYYDLTSSDMTVRDFQSIRIINMKSIFSDAGANEPMAELQLEGPEQKIRSLTKTKFFDDDGY